MAGHGMSSGEGARSSAIGAAASTAFALAVAAPDVALACTNCALRDSAPGRNLLLWGMILLPWSVVGLSLLVIRRMTKKELADEASAPALEGSEETSRASKET